MIQHSSLKALHGAGSKSSDSAEDTATGAETGAAAARAIAAAKGAKQKDIFVFDGPIISFSWPELDAYRSIQWN